MTTCNALDVNPFWKKRGLSFYSLPCVFLVIPCVGWKIDHAFAQMRPVATLNFSFLFGTIPLSICSVIILLGVSCSGARDLAKSGWLLPNLGS